MRLIDTAALVAGLQSGQLSSAAIDVCDPERSRPTVAAVDAKCNCRIAYRIGQPEAVRSLRETVARIGALALRGEPLPNIVNGVK